MKCNWAIEIAGSGASAPETVVRNADFEKRLDTSDEWIVQRTGIRERRIAQPGESTLKFATAASREALRDAGLQPTDIDLIINATITPEHTLPSTACELQAVLGCRTIPAFDLVAACSGYVFALVTAAQYIECGVARNVLVIGAETMTRMIDMEDRACAVLFGDAAAATVVRRANRPGPEILAARLGVDGSRANLLWVPAGGAAEPASIRTLNERLHYVRMKGREVYKFAVLQMQQVMEDTLADAGVPLSELALLVPHQSNLRIIESACEKLGLPAERVVINIDRYANTSAASVPLALHEARRKGRIKLGDLVLLVAFGAGLTWGSVLMRF